MDERKRILFVDDDPLALASLKAAMGDMALWDMTFLEDGERALEAFRAAPFHVVLAPLRMAGSAGSPLLENIRVRYPATVRLGLSAPGDPGIPGSLADQVHQVLPRPCDTAFAKSVIQRVIHLGDQVRSDHTRELVVRIGRLPAMPALYEEISRLLDSERATVENLAGTIGKDLAMTAMLLKLANSAFFNLPHEVATPEEAVSLLGIDLLRSLVLAHGLFTQAGAFRFPTFSLAHLWRHSVAVATAASQIAELEGLGRSRAGECFTAGLLHDIGILILASRFPQEYVRVLETSRILQSDLENAEFHVLGTTHSEVGAYLLGLWALPPALADAAAWHHLPQFQTPRAFTPALAVHAADALLAGDPEHEVFATTRLNEVYLRELGLWERVPAWQARIEADAVGLKEFFF